jgi:hypothetical protein
MIRIDKRDPVSTAASREALIGLAGRVVAAHVAALEPLSAIAQRTPQHPPRIEAGVEALLHLHAARAEIDAAISGLLGALVLGGVRRGVLARLLGVREATLQRRLITQPLASARGGDLTRDPAAPGGWRVVRDDADGADGEADQ